MYAPVGSQGCCKVNAFFPGAGAGRLVELCAQLRGGDGLVPGLEECPPHRSGRHAGHCRPAQSGTLQ